MNSKIIETLKSYTPNTIGVKRESSVLIPLVLRDGLWHLMYEVRASHLNSQPGEICFPGGKMEPGETSEEAAVRETCEELNIKASDIEVISQIDSVLTSFNMLIHCHVGIVHTPFEEIKYSKDEVDHLFLTPVRHLHEHKPQKYKIDTKFNLPDDFPFEDIPEGKKYNFKTTSYPVLFYQFGEKVIWGLTARMTERFIELISDHCDSMDIDDEEILDYDQYINNI